MKRESHGFRFLFVASARQSPVTIPKCAALCCNTISIIVDKVTIHRRVYPYSEPAAILDAQFPGSIKPTVTNNPGPTYLKKFRGPIFGLCSSLLNNSPNFISHLLY